MTPEPIDLVYTWVDDTWPGYLELLRAHAGNKHDRNPNRTRDNLQLLRYSLRSIERYAPWVRHVHLLTCRPQIPAWLRADHPRLRITHHDEIMEPAMLPTFNSFAIVSHAHLLPGLSRRFIYLDDDMLLAAPVTLRDFVEDDGRIRVLPRVPRTAPAARRADPGISPWNAAVAHTNHLLDQRYGAARRTVTQHAPLFIDRQIWEETQAEWADAILRTRRSRFRSPGDVFPEHLYVYHALATRRAAETSLIRSYRDNFYFPLENNLLQMRLQHAALTLLGTKFLTLNDNFDAHPDQRVVSYIRAALERWYPEPGSFER